MGRNKAAAVRLQVFKGREAKLNRTIFTILAVKGPMTVYALLHEIRMKRGFAGTQYGVVRQRVESLEKQDYLMKVAVAKTHVGSYAPVYQLTPRAEFALAISKINLNSFIQEASYAQMIMIVETFIFNRNQR